MRQSKHDLWKLTELGSNPASTSPVIVADKLLVFSPVKMQQNIFSSSRTVTVLESIRQKDKITQVYSVCVCLTLCNPMDCSPPGSYVHGILQTRILEWVAMLSSRGSSPTQGSNESISLMPPALTGRFFTIRTTQETSATFQGTQFQPPSLNYSLCSYSE